MNLEAKKLELVQMILNTEEPSVLSKVEAVLKKEKEADWWDELDEEVKAALKQSLAEADRGELLSHEEVLKEVRAKYKKG